MKNILFCLFLTILSFQMLVLPVKADNQINKYGIHILVPDEIFQAAKLVNSTGGDWGWVTIVIRDDQMEKDIIQKFFDNCREFHLIPLIRIATHMEKDYWTKPVIEDVNRWLNFFDDLNWPVQNRYLIIYNEPNQNKEWGGQANPTEYGLILAEFIKQFKANNPDYQILNSGFDLAAPNSKTTMDAIRFWQEMEKSSPGIFEKLDGWASHSYPNHGFVGTPFQSGRTSVRGYLWELLTLSKYFKISNDLPVFITETGWPYKISKKESYYSPEITAENIKLAYDDIWNPDPKVMAVTPFVLFYPEVPFSNFSWIDKQNRETPQYTKIKDTPKNSWWPVQETKYEFKNIFLPPFLPTDSSFSGKLTLKNVGQSIWGERGAPNISGLEMLADNNVKPGESAKFNFELYSGTISGQLSFSWGNLPEFKIWVLPSSVIVKVEYNLWQKLTRPFIEFFHKAE